MPTRSEIQDTLAASQEQVLAFFDGLSPEALECPCTASGVPGEALCWLLGTSVQRNRERANLCLINR
jgi:hypothetical protein